MVTGRTMAETRSSWTNWSTLSNQLRTNDDVSSDMEKLAKANDNMPVYKLNDDLLKTFDEY